MKRSELTAMTVAALNTLAKKLNISLPARAKKADIVDALAAAGKAKKAKRMTSAVKSAPAAAGKAAKKKAVRKKKSAPAKKKDAGAPARKKSVPAKKRPAAPGRVREWKLPPGTEEPLLAQERVADAKFYTGPALQQSTGAADDLPRAYQEDRITILSRDPYVAYAYWEATPARIERERSWFGWDSKLCVRIYDVTGVQFDGRNATGYFDQEVAEQAGSWYFDFGRPTHSFCADIGLLSPEGRYLTIARSNYITMPRDGASDVIDEEWMLADEEFWMLYGYPEGFRQGVSSPEMQEMLKRRRAMEITSPGLRSRERHKRK